MKVPQPVALALMLAATPAAIGVGGAPSVATASDRSPSSVSTPTGTNAPAMPLYLHPGKILASNCFQCHGTDGKGGPFDGIAGEPAAELFKELKELQTTPDVDEAIMRVHAQAYTDAQLRLIADYFASVR